MNESEPPMRCRENDNPVKTQRSMMPGEECSGYLLTGYLAGVTEEAWGLFRLSYGTREVLQKWRITRERHKQGNNLWGQIPTFCKMADYFVVVMKLL